MQQRAGLLFLAKTTSRILLILEDSKWTVPTFARKSTLLEDAEELLNSYSKGRIVPIELYLSEDRGFEYGTYVCLVEQEFLTTAAATIAWSSLDHLPKQLHNGLKATLNNTLIRTKIETVLELEMSNLLEKSSRFQEDYTRYQSIIAEMPEGDFKQDVNQLLKKLVVEIKKLDSMHMEMVYTRQLPSMGTDMKQEITTIRKNLETKIKDYQQSK
jgi:hypothetical protein